MNSIEKSSYVKDEITKSLLKMMETEKLEKISIRDLCNQAGVGRASFYRNFESKEDVIHEYSLRLIRKWSNEFESDKNANPFEVFESLFQHFQKYKSFYELLYKSNMLDIILDTIKEKVGFTATLPNQDAYSKAFFSYGLYGWISEWIHRGMQESPYTLNQMIKQSTQIIANVMNELFSLE